MLYCIYRNKERANSMTKKLKDIDSNKLGDYLEDYSNEGFNKNLRKFLVLDDYANIENILATAEFTDVEDSDIKAGIAVAEATLVEVNRVLRAQGIDFEFKRFDCVDYESYMLVNTNCSIKATAQRIREYA
jgi:hypothetical protein